jgi:hypothetical protein
MPPRPSAPSGPPLTKHRKQKQRYEALEQKVNELQEKVRQLQVGNHALQLRHHILGQLCAATSLLSHVFEQNGPHLAGPLLVTMPSSMRSALAQLEGYVASLMTQADMPPSSYTWRLEQPQCRVTSLEDHLAAAVMDGTCLSLVRYALATAAAQPQEYAHVPAVNMAVARGFLTQLWGEWLHEPFARERVSQHLHKGVQHGVGTQPALQSCVQFCGCRCAAIAAPILLLHCCCGSPGTPPCWSLQRTCLPCWCPRRPARPALSQALRRRALGLALLRCSLLPTAAWSLV